MIAETREEKSMDDGSTGRPLLPLSDKLGYTGAVLSRDHSPFNNPFNKDTRHPTDHFSHYQLLTLLAQ